MTLWNELDNYTKIPICTYGAVEKISKMIAEDRVHQFLMGLDDDLSGMIWSQILASDPLLHLDKNFNMVQQEENHKSVMTNRDQIYESASAFVATSFMQTLWKNRAWGSNLLWINRVFAEVEHLWR